MSDPATLRPPISVNIYDTKINIWQDDANDPSYYSEVFGPLIRSFRDLGWSIKPDPSTKKHFPTLSAGRRLGAKGNMRVDIRIMGRHIEVEYWATTWPIDNRNGRRHDFDKLRRMDFLDRLRFELETRRIIAWLETLAQVTVDIRTPRRLTALQKIERDYAESWHTDKALGRPVCKQPYNSRSRDNLTVEHGATIWFTGSDGRIRRGTAYYNINSMWWVVCDPHTLLNLPCGEIYCREPLLLRMKDNARKRRARLESELAAAVRKMDFQRAEILKNILFGSEPTFRIWARDKAAYYRSNCSGYTTDTISAGLYTRDQAERECRRVPHELEMVDQDGRHIRFEAAS